MTQDQREEIIRMAREAGFEVVDGQLRLYFDGSKALLKPNYMGTIVDGLKEFAALVAAHEREKQSKSHREFAPGNGKLYNLGYDAGYKAAFFKFHEPHEDCKFRKCMEHFTPEPNNQGKIND